MAVLYNLSKWKRLREIKLNTNPVCEVCNSSFNLEIDHICDHNNNETLFFDIDNLQTLCHEHHSKKTLFDAQLKDKQISDNRLVINITDKVMPVINSYISFLHDYERVIDKYINRYFINNTIDFWFVNKQLTYYFIRKIAYKSNKAIFLIKVNKNIDINWLISLLDNLKIKYEVNNG